MGIYIFTWSKLREYLIADEADEKSSNDFGKNIIPAMLDAGEKMTAYRFQGYWKDVGTIDSLWDANMDMLSPDNGIDPTTLNGPSTPAPPSAPPISWEWMPRWTTPSVTSGCEVYGTVENSVLFHSVTVEEARWCATPSSCPARW